MDNSVIEKAKEHFGQIIEDQLNRVENMKKAALTLAEADGALHLRTLQSINDLSSDQSNTTIWMIPNDGFKVINKMLNQNK